VLEGAEADERADIFAFGATVFEMATGKRAFEGKSQASVIARDPRAGAAAALLDPGR
jgi:serine/threonine protein kinase